MNTFKKRHHIVPYWKEVAEFSIQHYTGPENRYLRIETAMRGSIPRGARERDGLGEGGSKWTAKTLGWVQEPPEVNEYLR